MREIIRITGARRRTGLHAIALVPALALFGLLLCPSARAQEEWRLDAFDKTYAPNTVYDAWEARKIAPLFGSGDRYFFQFVHKGPDEHFLHLESGKDNSFSLGVQKDFVVADWPILSWEWKVSQLPKGGDVRSKAKDDQAGSMCLIVNPGLVGFFSLCYLYENAGPKDTPITSTKRDDSRYLILRTAAEDGKDTWHQERRNLLEDYRRVFGKAPEQKAIIGAQIDSDDTRSSGSVYYRNIVLHKK